MFALVSYIYLFPYSENKPGVEAQGGAKRFGLRILAKAVEAWACSGQEQRIGQAQFAPALICNWPGRTICAAAEQYKLTWANDQRGSRLDLPQEFFFVILESRIAV